MSSSTYRYIDIDSSYRNRQKFPLPTDFVINVAYTANQFINPFQSGDPIVAAYPTAIAYTQLGSTDTEIVLDPSSSNINNFYVNQYLQIGSEYRIIASYTASTRVATVKSPFSVPPAPGVMYYIRSQMPLFSSNLVPGSSQTSLNLGPASSSTSGIYEGNFVYFTNGPNVGRAIQISNYNGLTKTAKLAKPLPDVPGGTDSYEILAFTKDNSYPLIYPGTIGFSQPVCYSVELLYLIIPNVDILSSYGGTFSKYPYLYVKLYNEGNPHAGQTLYSNNPNANVALFKVPIGLNLLYETFFTLRDAKMIQVVKFKPDQPLRFTITFPDGSPVVFSTPDTLSPSPPDPFKQVSATFSIRRLDGNLGDSK